MKIRPCTIVFALFAAAAPASAAPITSLYSTGQGSVGAPDPHYTLVSAPNGSNYDKAYVVVDDGQFPFDAYWARNSFSPPNAPPSGWIAPTANVNTTHPAGEYTYQTTFDLSGRNPATATITGFIAADNGVKVYLNDLLVGSIYEPAGYTFTKDAFANQSLLITSGFLPGQNTLRFVVSNEVQATGNPTGLRVAVSGTADPVSTPEPATLGVLGALGVAGAGYVRRRKAAVAA